MNDTCTICGVAFTEPSFGGPGICPACDCGYDNKEAQRKEIERLRLQLSRAKEWMQHKSDCCAPKAGERDCCCGLKAFLKEADGE